MKTDSRPNKLTAEQFHLLSKLIANSVHQDELGARIVVILVDFV